MVNFQFPMNVLMDKCINVWGCAQRGRGKGMEVGKGARAQVRVRLACRRRELRGDGMAPGGLWGCQRTGRGERCRGRGRSPLRADVARVVVSGVDVDVGVYLGR